MSDISAEMEQDLTEGSLRIGGTRYMLIRPETLEALFSECGDRAEGIFFSAGQIGGELSAKRIQEETADARESIIRMLNMGAGLGWGRMQLISFDGEAMTFEVEARNSPLAWKNRRGCKLFEGVLSGLARVVFGAEIVVKELACEADGDERCLFRASPAP